MHRAPSNLFLPVHVSAIPGYIFARPTMQIGRSFFHSVFLRRLFSISRNSLALLWTFFYKYLKVPQERCRLLNKINSRRKIECPLRRQVRSCIDWHFEKKLGIIYKFYQYLDVQEFIIRTLFDVIGLSKSYLMFIELELIYSCFIKKEGSGRREILTRKANLPDESDHYYDINHGGRCRQQARKGFHATFHRRCVLFCSRLIYIEMEGARVRGYAGRYSGYPIAIEFRRKGGSVATSHPFVLSDLSFLLETPATTLSVRKLSLSIQSPRCVLHRAPNAFGNSVEEKLLYLDIYWTKFFFFYVGELSFHRRRRRTKEKSTGNNAKNSSNVPGPFHSMGKFRWIAWILAAEKIPGHPVDGSTVP